MKDTPQASRRPPAEAGSELLVLQRWEAFCAWLLPHTGRWPKSSRFTFGQRVQNHALDVVELLVVARFQPKRRRRSLERANLLLERMRHLFRLARGAQIMGPRGFESAMIGLEETGRMLGGWRKSLESGRAYRPRRARSSGASRAGAAEDGDTGGKG